MDRMSLFLRSLSKRNFSKVNFKSLNVFHDKNSKKFIINLQDDHAFLRYDHLDDTTLDLQQVVTPPAFQGQGIASLLVKEALRYGVQEQFHMKATCGYVKVYLDENPHKNYNHLIVK